MIWTWTIRIVLFLVCLGLHFLGTEEITGESDYSNQPTEEPDVFHSHADICQDDFEHILEESNAIANDLRSIMFERNDILSQAQELISTGATSIELQEAVTRNNELFLKSIKKYNSYIHELNNASNYKTASKILLELRRCIHSMKAENQHVLTELNKIFRENNHNNFSQRDCNSSTNIDESLFNGCKTKDDLTKRYRKLMQTFHPDNATGDTAMTQKIQNTYEHLLKNM